MREAPILVVEVISASQNIRNILEKAERMVKAVWSVES
jgi:Uma2 family endonuclease